MKWRQATFQKKNSENDSEDEQDLGKRMEKRKGANWREKLSR